MPAVQGSRKSIQVPPDAFRVLVTGFGPFQHYQGNPSWLAVSPLQNEILHTDVPSNLLSSNPKATAQDPVIDTHPRPIHITTLQIPVVYESVLAIVPGLHARPPILPEDAPEDCADPPENYYDFVFHLGVAGRGPLRMERVGHKLGYHMKDAKGQLAPIVRVSTKDFTRRENGGAPSSTVSTLGEESVSAAENMERERLGMDLVEQGSENAVRPSRGFGIGYTRFPDEINTEIDVTRLVQDLKKSGVDQIYTSMDAGHYLCDFIYYCSLAEVKRSSNPYEKSRNTQVLFLHCPPVNQPLSTEEVTDAIKRIVVWVCSEQQIHDSKDEAAATAGVTK
ncbi:peptidase C15, pyroglutamyl peptidase I-like protein [Agrocybe pediades]|nr:peptidase C15, pyroglutamyl peptidase I-like protein [Agrocybe pediades]